MTRAVIATSKISRAASLTGAGLNGLTLRRSTDQTVRRNAELHISQRLGRLRGLPQKMGQILSMSEDGETASAFEPLTGSAEPVALEQLLPVLEQTWGRDVYDVCREIEPRGLAASLGQVHRATLHDGRVVAIKIQYPGMERAVTADLDLLGWISKPVGGLQRGFDQAAYRETLRQSLDEELDYELEAQQQQIYAEESGGLGIVVPEVVTELSGKLVLTTLWQDGETLAETLNWAPERRARLARALAKHFFVMLFERGRLHADPHAGNYRFRDTAGEPEVVLYDYGCMRQVPRRERLALMRLIHETHNNPNGDPFPLFVAMGFDADTLSPLRHKLPALCRVLFAPFAAPATFDLGSWDRSARISDILGDDRWNFRISGPARLIFLMRAFHGLTYYLHALGEPINWSLPFEALVEAHSPALAQLELSAPTDQRSNFSTLAQHLCIRVTDQDTVKAKISLPASAVERLDELLDEDVRQRIQARDISLADLVVQARVNQYVPQELFRLEEQDKVFEVWLA